MNRLMITSVLFLTACAPAGINAVPDALTEPVQVTCREGTISRALGECAIALRAGLDDANSRLVAIRGIVNQ
jgi:hypothetical protein